MPAKEMKREKCREAKALVAAVLDKMMAMSEGILEAGWMQVQCRGGGGALGECDHNVNYNR